MYIFSDRNSSKVRFISGVDYHGDELPLIKPDIVKQISSTEELFTPIIWMFIWEIC